jgi:hypothetical protein
MRHPLAAPRSGLPCQGECQVLDRRACRPARIRKRHPARDLHLKTLKLSGNPGRVFEPAGHLLPTLLQGDLHRARDPASVLLSAQRRSIPYDLSMIPTSIAHPIGVIAFAKGALTGDAVRLAWVDSCSGINYIDPSTITRQTGPGRYNRDVAIRARRPRLHNQFPSLVDPASPPLPVDRIGSIFTDEARKST